LNFNKKKDITQIEIKNSKKEREKSYSRRREIHYFDKNKILVKNLVDELQAIILSHSLC